MKSWWMVCALALLIGCSEGGGMAGDGGTGVEGGTGGEGGEGGTAGGGRGPEPCTGCLRTGTDYPLQECSDEAGAGGNGGQASGGNGGEECESDSDCPDLCSFGGCYATRVCVQRQCRINFPCPTCAYQCSQLLNDGNDCMQISCVPLGGSALGGYCDFSSVQDGTPCVGGTCEAGACKLTDDSLPCTDQGLRNAVLAGGGPYTFDCSHFTSLSGVGVERNLILEGGGRLKVDRISVGGNATVELRDMTLGSALNGGTLSLIDCVVGGVANSGAMTLTRVEVDGIRGGIDNEGTMDLTDVVVSGGPGILNEGTMNGFGVTVSGNSAQNQAPPPRYGSGVINRYLKSRMTLTNCTISGNYAVESIDRALVSSVLNWGDMTLTGCTVVGDGTLSRTIHNRGMLSISKSVVEGGCSAKSDSLTSLGHNVETSTDTCGLDEPTDLVEVSADDLKLGPLRRFIWNNGVATGTHALGEGSVAIDVIPEADCVDADGEPLTTDQRGEPRPETGGTMCDVGAFEVQP